MEEGRRRADRQYHSNNNGNTHHQSRSLDPTGKVTAKTLTYNGSEQDLVTAEAITGGEIQVSDSETGSYSTTVPTGTDAKDYSVWYKAVPTDTSETPNYTASDAKSLTVTISKASISGATVTINPTTVADASENVTVTVALDGKNLTETTDYTFTKSDPQDGTITVTVTGTGNYTGTATGTYTVQTAEEPAENPEEPATDPDPEPEPEPATEPESAPQPTVTETDDAGNTVVSQKTVFTKDGAKILSVDIAFTLASTDLAAVSGEKFEQNISIDVTLELASDSAYTDYSYSISSDTLPEWLASSGPLAGADPSHDSKTHVN